MNLKKTGNLFTSKFVGTWSSSYKKGLYRAAVSRRLINTALETSWMRRSWPTGVCCANRKKKNIYPLSNFFEMVWDAKLKPHMFVMMLHGTARELRIWCSVL